MHWSSFIWGVAVILFIEVIVGYFFFDWMNELDEEFEQKRKERKEREKYNCTGPDDLG